MTPFAAAGLAVAVALPSAACALALAGLLPGGKPGPARLLAASLSLGGLGLASIPVFVWRLLGGRLGGAFLAADLATFAALTAGAAWLTRRLRSTAAEGRSRPDGDRLAALIGVMALLAVTAAALWGSAIQAERFPQGQWDAWAVWNLRARFLYRAADGRAALLADPPLSHFDYPLLLPASVARLWAYAGRETTLAPILVAFLFTFAAAALCGSALLVLRGATVAVTASLLVLANSDFLVHGQSQYADVPAGYFLLAAVVLLAWHDRMARPGARPWALLLAGLAAGLSAWTKHEGLLFVTALLAARGAPALLRRDQARLRTEAAWVGAGLALPLAAAVLYRLGTPHANWLLDTQAGPLPDRVLDASRLRLILEQFGRNLFGFGWGAALAAAGLAFLLALPGRAEGSRPLWPLGVIGLATAGYVLVFLASPFDLRWHLDTTVHRLLCQLWPAAVFALFLAAAPAPPPDPAADPPTA